MPTDRWIIAGPKRLPGGRVAAVIPLLFGRARITVGHESDWQKQYSDSW